MEERPTSLLLPRLTPGMLWIVVGAAGLILLGWLFQFEPLIRLGLGRVAMNPVTGLSFIFAACSLLLLDWSRRVGRPWGGHAGLVLACLVLLAGGLRMAAYIGSIQFDIDELLFRSRLLQADPHLLSEMAPNTALGFVLLGLGLLLERTERPGGLVAGQAAVLATGLIALLVLIGYSYREWVLYRVGTAVPMALDTAVLFALLCLAYLARRPDTELIRVLTSRTAGGTLVRCLLPMAVAVPWILGALLLAGESAGYFQWDFAVSIFAVISIVVFTGLIWWHGKQLYLVDVQRVLAERRMAAQHQTTRLLAESASRDGVLRRFLQVLGENLEWPFGIVWKADARSQTLHCEEVWSSTGPATGRLVDASRAAALPKGAELPGRVWAQAQPLSEAQTESSVLERAAAASGLKRALAIPIWAGEQFFGVVEFFSADGEQAEPDLLNMLGVVGTQLGLFLERTHAEEQLRLASANLQRSNTDLQQFAYVASHDLFEPLRMVTSYLELLTERYDEKLDARGREFISFALDGARRMDALIRDLLAYSRVELRGRSFEPVDCPSVLNAALSNLKVAVEESGAVISHGPLPTVLGDSVQLTQVFQNLIGNAIKFRGSAVPRIEVSAQHQGQEWLFSVRDNGIGIDPKQFNRLFVIFQRLHTRQEYAGTGMGLAICKKIIERHGGRIWLESVPGQGSTFWFTLAAERSAQSVGRVVA